MPLNAVFIGFIAIVTIIRLGLIMSGPMDIRDKVTKIGHWMIGLVCVVIAWIALGKIFGVETNGFKGGSAGNGGEPTTTTNLDDTKTNVNNQTYYGSGYEDETKDVQVKVTPHN